MGNLIGIHSNHTENWSGCFTRSLNSAHQPIILLVVDVDERTWFTIHMLRKVPGIRSLLKPGHAVAGHRSLNSTFNTSPGLKATQSGVEGELFAHVFTTGL